MAAVAASWENVVDTDIIRLDSSRYDIATSIAAASADLAIILATGLVAKIVVPMCIRGAVPRLGYLARGAPAVR